MLDLIPTRGRAVSLRFIFDEPGEHGYHRVGSSSGSVRDHRQDSKGTWWMPWHLESMKDVDDCDKPR